MVVEVDIIGRSWGDALRCRSLSFVFIYSRKASGDVQSTPASTVFMLQVYSSGFGCIACVNDSNFWKVCPVRLLGFWHYPPPPRLVQVSQGAIKHPTLLSISTYRMLCASIGDIELWRCFASVPHPGHGMTCSARSIRQAAHQSVLYYPNQAKPRRRKHISVLTRNNYRHSSTGRLPNGASERVGSGNAKHHVNEINCRQEHIDDGRNITASISTDKYP